MYFIYTGRLAALVHALVMGASPPLDFFSHGIPQKIVSVTLKKKNAYTEKIPAVGTETPVATIRITVVAAGIFFKVS